MEASTARDLTDIARQAGAFPTAALEAEERPIHTSGMRAIVMVVLVGLPAAAQPDGVWTGYVGGFKQSRPATPRFVAPPSVPAWQWQAAAIQQQQWALQADAQRLARQQAELSAAQQRLDLDRQSELELARFERIEAERRLLEAKEALVAQQLELDRRLAAEREAAQLEAQRRSATPVVLPPSQPLPSEEKPAPPATPGNDIYRWVDSRGVTHYSTKVPEAARHLATKVGASRQRSP